MLNKKLRLTMAIVLLLSILVTTYATTIEALAKSFVEYEQEQYLKNGPSPMDATPNNISLGGDQTALPGSK